MSETALINRPHKNGSLNGTATKGVNGLPYAKRKIEFRFPDAHAATFQEVKNWAAHYANDNEISLNESYVNLVKLGMEAGEKQKEIDDLKREIEVQKLAAGTVSKDDLFEQKIEGIRKDFKITDLERQLSEKSTSLSGIESTTTQKDSEIQELKDKVKDLEKAVSMDERIAKFLPLAAAGVATRVPEVAKIAQAIAGQIPETLPSDEADQLAAEIESSFGQNMPKFATIMSFLKQPGALENTYNQILTLTQSKA